VNAPVATLVEDVRPWVGVSVPVLVVDEEPDRGTPTFNGFAYHFGNVQIAASPDKWTVLTNTRPPLWDTVSYQITDGTLTGFVAASAWTLATVASIEPVPEHTSRWVKPGGRSAKRERPRRA